MRHSAILFFPQERKNGRRGNYDRIISLSRKFDLMDDEISSAVFEMYNRPVSNTRVFLSNETGKFARIVLGGTNCTVAPVNVQASLSLSLFLNFLLCKEGKDRLE